MKKILWVFLGGMVAALLAGAVLIWDATADATMSVIMANTRYIERQMPFDYDTLIVGSHFLKPKIIMTNPSLRFTTPQAKYRLVAAQVEFVGSFSSLGEYTIKLPKKFMLEKIMPTQERVLFEIRDYPEMEVRSSEPVEGKPAESIYLDEFKLEKHKSLVLAMRAGEDPKARKVELKFTPPEFITMKWTPIRYELGAYLSRFSDTVQQVRQSAAVVP